MLQSFQCGFVCSCRFEPVTQKVPAQPSAPPAIFWHHYDVPIKRFSINRRNSFKHSLIQGYIYHSKTARAIMHNRWGGRLYTDGIRDTTIRHRSHFAAEALKNRSSQNGKTSKSFIWLWNIVLLYLLSLHWIARWTEELRMCRIFCKIDKIWVEIYSISYLCFEKSDKTTSSIQVSLTIIHLTPKDRILF